MQGSAFGPLARGETTIAPSPAGTSPSAPTSPGRRNSLSSVVSWSLYDLANTVFYLLVVTIHLPRYLGQVSGNERTISYGFVPAMFLSGLLSPAFGAWLDRCGLAKRMTLGFTFGCCAVTALLGATRSPFWLCVSFAVSLFAYQMASVAYQSLLPVVASPQTVGRVSGLGVALGYLGNVVALAMVSMLGLEQRWGSSGLFVLAAVSFAAFTIPFWIWVPRTPRDPGDDRPNHGFFAGLSETFAILRRNFGTGPLAVFLLGNFLVCDGINTVLVQLAQYACHPGGLGLTPEQRSTLLIVINVAAVLGGVSLGLLADRWGGKKTTLLSSVLLVLAIAWTEFVPSPWPWLRFAALAVFGGAGIAGVWTASRLWLLHLVPADRNAEAFGLYGLTLKLSLLSLYPFTVLVDRTGSYRSSILLLLAVLTAGTLLWTRAPRALRSGSGSDRSLVRAPPHG